MSQLPGIVTHRKPKKMALDSAQKSALVYGDPIVIETGQTDSGNSVRSTVLRPGNVVAKKSGSTKFVVADDYAHIDQGTAAAVVSAEAPDGDWASKVLKLFRNGVKVAEVTAAATDDTLAEWLTLLNGDQAFAANAEAADDGAGKLEITDQLGIGAIRVEINLNTAYANAFDSDDDGTNDSSYAEDENDLVDVRVILEEVDMLDAGGNADDGFCSENAWAGIFRVSDLITGGSDGTIPASAKGVLRARGSQFAS